MLTPAIGVIGGSGLYAVDDFTVVAEHQLSTPFGEPSDVIVEVERGGRRVFFLPRHARGHRLLPHEINHRANLYALRSLGVRWLVSVSAVGSLSEKIAPRDVVVPDQFFDHTSHRTERTFFGQGIVAHVSLADPVNTTLSALLAEIASEVIPGVVHRGGTYLQIDGPAFSTRAESEDYRKRGFAVIGMTVAAEAKLAREAEMAFAALNLVTDYDCWHQSEAPVEVETVLGHLQANAAAAQKMIARAIERIALEEAQPEHRSLQYALLGDRSLWPEATKKKLHLLLANYLDQ